MKQSYFKTLPESIFSYLHFFEFSADSFPPHIDFYFLRIKFINKSKTFCLYSLIVTSTRCLLVLGLIAHISWCSCSYNVCISACGRYKCFQQIFNHIINIKLWENWTKLRKLCCGWLPCQDLDSVSNWNSSFLLKSWKLLFYQISAFICFCQQQVCYSESSVLLNNNNKKMRRKSNI